MPHQYVYYVSVKQRRLHVLLRGILVLHRYAGSSSYRCELASMLYALRDAANKTLQYTHNETCIT